MQTVKREKKRSLRAILLILLIVAVILIGSTYAWFIANTTTSVETINVKIESVEGLQISVDATTWKSSITNSDITGAGATYSNAVNQLPNKLKPCSSIGNIEDGKQVIFTQKDEGAIYTGTDKDNGRSLQGTALLTAERGVDTHGTDGKYITFDLFLNLQSNDTKKLYLSPNSGCTFDEESAKNDPNIRDTTKGLENATRISFIVEGYAATADAATAQNWKYSETNTDCKFVLWEPNSNAHEQDAVDNGTGEAPSDVPGYNVEDFEGMTKKNPVPYSGVKAEIDANDKVYMYKAKATNFPAKLANVTPTIWTSNGEVDKKDTTITLKPGITKIRVYMWLEGQDIDCYTGASGTYLNFDLQFQIDTATGG